MLDVGHNPHLRPPRLTEHTAQVGAGNYVTRDLTEVGVGEDLHTMKGYGVLFVLLNVNKHLNAEGCLSYIM